MSLLSLVARERTPSILLPEPHNVRYAIKECPSGSTFKNFRLELSSEPGSGLKSHQPLYHDSLRFTDLLSENSAGAPSGSNNSAWARARRSPISRITWTGNTTPTVGQIWIVVYSILSQRHDLEVFRIELSGTGSGELARHLQAVGLAITHPKPAAPPGQSIPESDDHICQQVVLRRSFWQGAGSPFGPRPVWLAGSTDKNNSYPCFESSYPTRPLDYTLTTGFPSAQVHITHPIRPTKPTPGTTIYSRYIPHLKETFSMVALDWQNEEHLRYFNVWQNEPRVAQGWNETGTLEEHREYLRKTHVDPHQFAVLGKFDDTFFAYFEIYWAKEDIIGAYYDAGDYDRGRHFLVGDARFRGPHRVKAWHSSLTHYMFLDEPRTNLAVGEPRATGAKVLAYDQDNGYHIGKLIDLPHKRAALVQCPRERFFQNVPFEYEEKPKL